MDFPSTSNLSSSILSTVQTALQANNKHQHVLSVHAQRLTAELQLVDRLIDSAEKYEEDPNPHPDIQIVGSKRASGPVLPGELANNPRSPFSQTATVRNEYLENTASYTLKPKEVEELTLAVRAEHLRIMAIDAQSQGKPMPSADTPIDFNTDIERLDWAIIAEKVTDAVGASRSATEYRIRWLGEKHPRINHATWDKEELQKLQDIVKTFPTDAPIDWVDVSSRLGTERVPLDCMRKAIPRQVHKWDEASNERLKNAVAACGLNNWNLVARYVSQHATALQCQGQYGRILDENLKHGLWSKEEDKRLAEAVAGHGTNWPNVASAMLGRNYDQCRDRWRELDRKNIPNAAGSREWTEKEDRSLRELVKLKGNKWKKISAELGAGFTDKQCKVRYLKLVKDANAQNASTEETSEWHPSNTLDGMDSVTPGTQPSGSTPTPTLSTGTIITSTSTESSSATSSLTQVDGPDEPAAQINENSPKVSAKATPPKLPRAKPKLRPKTKASATAATSAEVPRETDKSPPTKKRKTKETVLNTGAADPDIDVSANRRRSSRLSVATPIRDDEAVVGNDQVN